MGRKIPAKKHRGVKDPLKQQAQRWKILKTKINAPPGDPDSQPVPRSLTELFARAERRKDAVAARGGKDKPARKVSSEEAGGEARNPLATLRQLPGEGARAFSLRINSSLRTLAHPLLDAAHYPEDLEREDAKGVRMAAQRERRERKRARAARDELRAARRAGGAGGEGEPAAAAVGLTRGQKLTARNKARKMKAAQVGGGGSGARREVQLERVPFGECAHAPPALTARPRHAPRQDGAPRPGRRALLLTSLLAPAPAPSHRAAPRAAPPPPAEQQRRERARLAAVAAYRALKQNRKPTNHVIL